MLTNLKIENVAVIETARISFGEGLNVLSGETGAGKSIVIDAINAVLGERTSKEVVRSGEASAKVTAFFEAIGPQAKSVLESFELDAGDDDSLLISRSISADGRSSCKINGQSVSVSMLRRLGRELITICGQHDSQHLLQKESHLAYIDLLADCETQRDDYLASFEKLRQVKRELQRLYADETDKQSRLDFLSFQIAELENAGITIGEHDRLISEKKKFQNKEKLVSALQTAQSTIDGNDVGGGLLTGLYALSNALSALEDVDKSFSAFVETTENFRYELEEIRSSVSGALASFDDDTIDIDEIEARLDVLYRLSNKYGHTEEEMLETLDALRAQYDGIAFAQERKNELEQQAALLEEEVFQKGCFLSDCRKAAALRFQAQVMEELAFLDMPNAVFEVQFEAQEPAADGLDNVEFLISANRGQSLKPLTKIASGGELSRIMLAIRCVLNDTEQQQTTIFDEIDSGVSGRAANKIAAKLQQVAVGRQVICVTHLAQIAAAADTHFLIEKTVDESNTYTKVKVMDGAAREDEIARMIGGEFISEATRSSARELIDFASRNA